jgi:hypothetical protein
MRHYHLFAALYLNLDISRQTTPPTVVPFGIARSNGNFSEMVGSVGHI